MARNGFEGVPCKMSEPVRQAELNYQDRTAQTYFHHPCPMHPTSPKSLILDGWVCPCDDHFACGVSKVCSGVNLPYL